jgi:broad specificity phosphatase PhoE/hypoxanthine phosphoribosyltransferase
VDIESWIAIILGSIGALASVWFLWEKLLSRKRLSWKWLQKAVVNMATNLHGYSPTVIVGIGRGGAIVGALLSSLLNNRPLLVIDRVYVWSQGRRYDDMICHLPLPKELIDRVLLVAGEVHTGNTMRLYYKFFKDMGANQVLRAAPYVQIGSTEPVEYKALETKKEMLLPWMFSDHYKRESISEQKSFHSRNQNGDICRDIFHNGFRTFVVRHGESEDNASEDRFSGVSDTFLSDKGKLQAAIAAKALRGKKIARIYTSPTKRAVATARMIQSESGGMLSIEPRLREMDFGDWEGMTKKDIDRNWPQQFAKWQDDPVLNAPENSENPLKVLERVLEFWNELAPGKEFFGLGDVVIVGHKTALRILLSHLNGENLSQFRQRPLENCSISEIFIDGEGCSKIEKENQTTHLKG